MTGKKIGRLKVLERAPNDKDNRAMFNCLCDCGNKTVVSGKHLRNGNTKSCGCRRKDGSLRRTHGMSKGKNRLYSIWLGMRQRCYYKKSPSYKRYGGRSIGVCKKWQKFENFFADMAVAHERHFSEHGWGNTTLDRIDNDKDYCKSNCRWATRKQQWENSRSNKKQNHGSN